MIKYNDDNKSFFLALIINLLENNCDHSITTFSKSSLDKQFDSE